VDVSEVTEAADRLSRVLLAGLAVEAKTNASRASKQDREESAKPYARPSAGPSAPPQQSVEEQLEGLPLVIPYDAKHQQDFDKRMFGEKTLNAILINAEVGIYPYVVMRSGPYPNALSPLKDGLNNNKWRAWFDTWADRAAKQEAFGKGSSNTAHLIELNDEDLTSEAALKYPRDQLPGGLPKKIIHRKSLVDELPTAEKAIEELIMTGYAAVSKIGPQLIIGYLQRPLGMYSAIELKMRVQLHCYLEAWTGDLNAPLGKRTIEPAEFAREFANLLQSSSSAGFWQVDAKPSNMLYRRDASGGLEICWTDFDPGKCFIMSPTARQEVGHCCVLAHAAQVMGFMSCVMGEEVFYHYLPAVQQELETRFKISEISNDEMCKFITRNPGAFLLDVEWDSLERGSGQIKVAIAQKLLDTLRWYVDDIHFARPFRGGDSKRCMLQKDSPKGKLQQFFDFALLQVGKPEVEEWASFSSKKAGGRNYGSESTAKD
tara:strand:+ start:9561 stop:11024 length:1464 start_codon:yes stop_codon:yes gene_type:complete